MLYPPRKRATATVTDSAGKQHTGELLLLTDYDVALQDSDGWYHSWPRRRGQGGREGSAGGASRRCSTKYTDSDMHNMLAYLETLEVRKLALLLAGAAVPAGAGARSGGADPAAHRHLAQL